MTARCKLKNRERTRQPRENPCKAKDFECYRLWRKRDCIVAWISEWHLFPKHWCQHRKCAAKVIESFWIPSLVKVAIVHTHEWMERVAWRRRCLRFRQLDFSGIDSWEKEVRGRQFDAVSTQRWRDACGFSQACRRQLDSAQKETRVVSATDPIVVRKHNRPLLLQKRRHTLMEERSRKVLVSDNRVLLERRAGKRAKTSPEEMYGTVVSSLASSRMSKLHVWIGMQIWRQLCV